jgi:hypothetical protein
MTTPIIPESIIQLFANEINKINEKVVKLISNKYKLNEDELNELVRKELNLTIIPEKEQKFKLVKAKVNGKNTNIEDRCEGRVYHKDTHEYKQCIRRKKVDCDLYCKTHYKKLPFGNIKDSI